MYPRSYCFHCCQGSVAQLLKVLLVLIGVYSCLPGSVQLSRHVQQRHCTCFLTTRWKTGAVSATKMPSGTRSRKRAKRESDEEHGMETHLAAKGQAAEATAAENSQTKRRRMEVAQVAHPSSLATSSPVPVVASSRRTRARRREAKQSTRDETTVKVEADEEDARPDEEVLPNLGHQSSQPVAEMPAVRIAASPIVVSDTSTLSAISENSISAKVEELDADTAGRQALRPLPQDNEEMRSATSMPGSGRYSLAEKGKGRASSPQGSPKADVTAQLKADMEGMRADLTKAKAVSTPAPVQLTTQRLHC